MAAGPDGQRRHRERAQIVLRAAEGRSNREIAEALGIRPATVSKGRVRFRRAGMEGLQDDYRSGRRPIGGEVRDCRRRLLTCLEEGPPDGHDRWDGRLLSQVLGVKPYKVYKELRILGINLWRRRNWSVSTDPGFVTRSTDLVGLYLGLPGNAMVLAVMESSRSLPPEEERGRLEMHDGASLGDSALEYHRRSTADLLAALEVATGQVVAGGFPRKREDEFLRYLDTVVAHHPHQQLFVSLDKPSVNFPVHEHPWRKRHPAVHFHFTDNHASWLHQIELWFRILSSPVASHESSVSPGELVRAIEAFVEVYGENAYPFQWRKVGVREGSSEV
mgnify:FL=1